MNELSQKLVDAIKIRRQNGKYQKVITHQQILLPPPIITSLASNKQSLPIVSSNKISIQPHFKRFKSKSQVQLKNNILPPNLLSQISQVQQSILPRNNSRKSVRPYSNSKHQHKNIESTPAKNTIPTSIKLTLASHINNEHTSHSKRNSKKGKSIVFDDLLKNVNQQIVLTVKFYNIQENGAYKSFISNLKTDMEDVNILIAGIRKFIIKHRIENGTIEVKQLMKLIKKKSISNFQYLNLFLNKNSINSKNIIGLSFYDGPKGKNLAAAKIQGFFKGISDRKYIKQLKSLIKKVKLIQHHWRNCLLSKKTRKLILQRINNKIAKFKILSKNLQQNWQLIKSSPRVEVHLGAYSVQQFKRLTTSNIQQHENIQLTRIFRAIETDITVIYISPISFRDNIIQYYQRIFANSGVSFKCKVFIITPQNISKLPSSLSTLSQLLYSPKALKKIKNLLQNYKGYSYIVPSFPSIEYINLAAQLNIPIFSSNPSIHKLYSNKSAFRSIMQISNIQTLKNVHSIYSQKQLINCISILIFKYPQIKRWYLKIDNEFHSRGLAIINTESFPFVKQLRKQKQLNEISQKQIIKIIAQEVTLKLKDKLKIHCKHIYQNYNDYISHFCTRGGVIQAQLTGKVYQYSISLYIEPNGQFKVIGTYNKLQLGGKTVCAIKSPAYHPSHNTIQTSHRIVRQLYKSLFIQMKMFGYFTVDLLANEYEEVYAIGLDCFLNQSTSSMFNIYNLTQAVYERDTNQIKKNYQNISKLQYIYCPRVGISNLPSFYDFFKNAKYGNISFDLKDKIGTFFLLIDQLQSSQIGVVWVQQNTQNLLEIVSKSCKYLTQQYEVNQQIRFLRGISIVLARKFKKKQQAKIEISLDDIF